MMLLVHLFVFDTNQATKIRQSILGDNHPVTISSLDFFTKVYAEAGADQYQGITDRQNDKMSAYLHSLLHVILCPFYIRLITYQCIKISPVPIKGLKVMIMRCIKPKNRKKRIFDNEIEQMNKKQGLLYAFRTTVYCIGLLLKLELDQCLLFYIR